MLAHAAVGFFCAAVVLCGCSARSALEIDLTEDAGVDAAPIEPDSGPPLIERADKVDLLLVIDNSRNLQEAHELFALTLPSLLERFARPACVNGFGNVVATTPSPDDPCPVGQREFPAVTDLHIGVISTSIGGHGADVCAPASPSFKEPMNDRARLLARNAAGGVVPTYAGAGFLAWDPSQTHVPPGDSDLPALTAKLQEITRGVGNNGCGFEAQLESIYRFLVDPDPYLEIHVEDGSAVPTGTDDVLLQQRADFLRPDSAVVTVLITDEDDCSTRDGGQFFVSNQATDSVGNLLHLPPPRSECAVDPMDPCCASCAQMPPTGCAPNENDPSCLLPQAPDETINLRCFDQKRRFGIDFLYPIDRYIQGFTQFQVAARDGSIVPNPLFAQGRSPRLALFAGILGVPWQDIASDPKSLGSGYLNPLQIDWALITGDPATQTPPQDPLMIASIDPRSGEHPLLGIPLAPPTAPIALANAINGHERDISTRDDLQYACIFPMRAPKDCTVELEGCECTGSVILFNPICQEPGGAYSNVQRFARALPSTRELRVLQGIGEQAVVASICAETVDDEGQSTFGYKPAVNAILHALQSRLR
jgi:hypothetical protein